MNAPAKKVDTYKVTFEEGCFSPLRQRTDEERAAQKLRSFDVTLSPDQEAAYDVVRRWMRRESVPVGSRDLLTLGGYAGSGKSTLISLLASDFANKRIAFAALTGRATGNMKRKMWESGLASPNHFYQTLHSLLYQCFTTPDGRLRWSLKKRESFGEFDAIVIDEASMVGGRIREHLESFDVPIFAVGDHGQLPPVGDTGDLMKRPDLRLEKIHRQAEGNPILELSRIVRETGDLPFSPPGGQSGSIMYVSRSDLRPLGRRLLNECELPDLAFLAWKNSTRVSTNGVLREIIASSHGSKHSEPPVVGDQVVCLKNAYRLAFNGMRGFIREVEATSSPYYYEGRIEFPDDNLAFEGTFSKLFFDRPRMPESLEEFEDEGLFIEDWDETGLTLDFGYCMTVHKAQGSQFDTVAYIREKVANTSRDTFRRHVYTGITRAQNRLFVLV